MYTMMEKQAGKNKKTGVDSRPIQADRTGIPGWRRKHFERASGLALDDVRVHYQSDRPARVGALAYTQGNHIYLGPGQERWLGHEIGHVVQQKQGRVKPTGIYNSFPINTDRRLELEADRIAYAPQARDEQKESGVLQRKSGLPLARRFYTLGMKTSDPVYELAEQYDKLENTESTRRDQVNLLSIMMLMLERRGDLSDCLLLAKDELQIVKNQRFEGLTEKIPDPYGFMNDSPYFTALGLQIKMRNATALDIIRRLSEEHLSKIRKKFLFIQKDFKIIKDLITREGALAHYSHTNHLTVLRSTKSLESMGMINRVMGEGESDKLSVDTFGISKSQELDTDRIRNTNFVFFFLERFGGRHRGGTRFGKYRYTIPLAGAGSGILQNAWAILHDLGSGPNQAERPMRAGGREISRQIKMILNEELFLGSHDMASIGTDTEMNNKIAECIRLFSSFMNKSVEFQGDKGRARMDTELPEIFLLGGQIVDGIAWRVVRELDRIEELSPEFRDAVLADQNSLWDYILTVVHDMQIMVPFSAMPKNLDWEESGKLHIEIMRTGTTSEQLFPKLEKKGAMTLGGMASSQTSANNCFFDTMFHYINDYADSQLLRTAFVTYLGTVGGALDQHAPVEFEHIQHFAIGGISRSMSTWRLWDWTRLRSHLSRREATAPGITISFSLRRGIAGRAMTGSVILQTFRRWYTRLRRLKGTGARLCFAGLPFLCFMDSPR